jgi:hypothetical protein
MRNPWKLTSFALASLLTVSLSSNLLSTASAEPQPKMREALESLRAAKAALEAATPDKGGHRVKAIAATNNAIGEVEAGIKFDNRR